MDRYVVKNAAAAAIVRESVAVSHDDRKQRTLHGLKKIVRMGKTSIIVFNETDLAQACSVLSDKDSSDNAKLESLRRLSCWQIGKADLLQSPNVGRQVRLLRHHRNREVAALASRLVDKWKALIIASSQPSLQAALTGPSQPMLANAAPMQTDRTQ